MGMCSICMDFERPYLLMNHLISILSHIQDKHPGVRPIMWDDMLRTVPTNIIKGNNIENRQRILRLCDFGSV